MIVPKGGWIRTIRKALGLTIKQLAKRLDLSTARIVQMEVSEQSNAATLKTLKLAAEAMDCVFVYRLLPKTSLENTVRQQAKKIATAQIARIAHTMDLEGQSAS